MFPISFNDILSAIVIASPVLGPLAIGFGAFILSKLPNNVSVQLHNIADDAAMIVEQTQAGMASTDKKAEALLVMQRLAKQFGLPFDPIIAGDLIELAVSGFNQYKPAVSAPANAPVPTEVSSPAPVVAVAAPPASA